MRSDQVKFNLESLVEIEKLVVESKMTDAQKRAYFTFVIDSTKDELASIHNCYQAECQGKKADLRDLSK